MTSAEGTQIGLLTVGQSPPLLLVHGGMGGIASWQSLWDALTGRWRVTAMDRRGRGSSGDTEPYDVSRGSIKEYARHNDQAGFLGERLDCVTGD